MPPQGESIGLALEDVVLLSRVIEKGNLDSVQQVFEKYEHLRRDRIEEAYEKANWNWGTQKDKGWLGWVMMEWMMSIFLWWTKSSKDDELAFDVRDIPI
jgi:2-polyprenyl-6-methoxyphenol hydroxylase-like FAD-dependent oxidoreductase